MKTPPGHRAGVDLPRLALITAGLLVLLACTAVPAGAQEGQDGSRGMLDPLKNSIARLASPGELAGPHRELDRPDTCSLCHTGPKGLDRARCLDCHKEIRARIEERVGYHGTLDAECWECHSDHQGREFAMVALDDRAFDHRAARYDLLGAHRRLECEKCHDARRAEARKYQQHYYVGLPTNCAGCHNSPHEGHFRQTCPTCHVELDWKARVPGFDHDRTRFPLTGIHRATACDKCHKKGAALAVNPQCTDCHADPHGGQYQVSCGNCHDTGAWKTGAAGVDHARTRFPLTGAHRGAGCSACHRKDETVKPGTGCISCHEDKHRGRFGPACAGCHTTGGWKGPWLTADHDKTRFQLTGAHLALGCVKCHTLEGGDGRLDPACTSCHQNPHLTPGTQACSECHDARSWQDGWPERIDHSATRFPLDATHDRLECRACHQMKTLSVPGLLCADCHSEVEEFYRGTYLAGLLADTEPDMMHGKVACRNCHAESDRGADLQAILHRCETCHPREYGDYALAWMSVVHREGRKALEKVGARCDTAAEAQRFLINRITGLAPHNFLRSARMLRTLQAGENE